MKTDLLLAHNVSLAGSRRLRLELNVLNVFNQKTARYRIQHLNRGVGTDRGSALIDLGSTDLAQGYDYNALIRATPDVRTPTNRAAEWKTSSRRARAVSSWSSASSRQV